MVEIEKVAFEPHFLLRFCGSVETVSISLAWEIRFLEHIFHVSKKSESAR